MFKTNPKTGIIRDEKGNLYPLHGYYYIPEFNQIIYCHDVDQAGERLLLGHMTNFVSDAFTNISRQTINFEDFWSYEPIYLSYSKEALNYVGEYPFLTMHDFGDEKVQRVHDIPNFYEIVLPKATPGGFIRYFSPGDKVKITYSTGQGRRTVSTSYVYVVTTSYKLVVIDSGVYFGGKDEWVVKNDREIVKFSIYATNVEIIK